MPGITRISFGSTLPTNCADGDIFIKTGSGAGVYWCSTPGSPGAWSAVGVGGISELTGDVTAGPGSGSQAATIANDAVTYPKMQNVSAASKLLGRGSASGAGDPQEITLGSNLSMAGTTLSATGGSGSGAITDTGAVGSEPGSPNSGDLFLPDNGYWLERYSGSVWEPWGPLFPLTRPNDASYAWVNQGSASVNTTNGGIFLLAPATAGDSVRIRKIAVPTRPYTITITFLLLARTAAPNSAGGIIWRESSSGKLVTFGCQIIGGVPKFNVFKWTGPTAFSAGYFTSEQLAFFTSLLFMRVTEDSTNRICSFSADGVNFLQMHSIGRTDFLTADEVGFFCNAGQATSDCGVTLLSWKQT